MALPVMSPEQREAALARAAQTRKERSEALGLVKNGTDRAADVLNDTGSPVQGAKVRQLLLAVPGIGQVKADHIMTDLGIDPGRRVRGLGGRQRERLTEMLTPAT